jgi:hypothetical protein
VMKVTDETAPMTDTEITGRLRRCLGSIICHVF